MNSNLNAKTIGQILIAIGVISVLDFIFLIIFFIGYFNNIPSIFFFGPLNDIHTSFLVILTAALATTILALQGRQLWWLNGIGVILSWIGAFIVTLDSLMAGNIIPNNSGAILSIKYGFPTFLTTHDVRFGFSLIGVWLVILNFQAMQTKPWPNYLIGLGFFAGIIMILGLAVNLPLEFIILYPVWCIWLGSHILKKAGKDNQ